MVKNLLLTASLAAATTLGASAQMVLGYQVNASQGASATVYNGPAENTEVTKIGWLPSGEISAAGEGEGFKLATPIRYMGQEMTHFVVYANGMVQFGGASIAYDPTNTAYAFSQEKYVNVVGAANWRGVSAGPNTSVSYLSDASGLTVNYTNLIGWTGWSDSDAYTMGLVLKIGVNGDVFMTLSGLSEASSSNQLQLRVGLKDGVGNCITYGGSVADASITVNSSSNLNINSPIADGYTLAFMAPGPGTTPAAQPTDLVVTPTTYGITGSFTPADSNCTLVLMSAGEPTEAPVDGVLYTKDQELGNAKVIIAGTEKEFDLRNLDPATSYTFTAYAYNSYCSDGAHYNTVDPLTVTVKTLPVAPEAFAVVASSKNSVTINATPSEGNKVLVAYSSVIEHDNFGDHAQIGALNGAYQAGDEIEGGGKVAYVGDAVENFVVEGLDASTSYYFVAYGMSTDNAYSSETINASASTDLVLPYTADFANAPLYELPGGWVSSSDARGTANFRLANNRLGAAGMVLSLEYSNRSSNGTPVWIQLPKVEVSGEKPVFHMPLTITTSASRFSTLPYNEWNEKDEFLIECSEDGENWTVAQKYDASNNPQFAELYATADFAADLSAFAGKTVYVRALWKCYSTAGFGDKLIITGVNIDTDGVMVPVVSVSDVNATSALVSWTGNAAKYEVSYGVVGSDEKTSVADIAASEYRLTGLQAETQYEVAVRAEGGEWSAYRQFTTPEPVAPAEPENLAANTDSYGSDGNIVLTWDAVANAESYIVRYRPSDGEEYTTVAGLSENTYSAYGLTRNTEYVWSVRAVGADGTMSGWSTEYFTVPDIQSGAAAVAAEEYLVSANDSEVVVNGAEGVQAVAVYDMAGRQIAYAEGNGSEVIRLAVSESPVVVNVTTAAGLKSHKLAH